MVQQNQTYLVARQTASITKNANTTLNAITGLKVALLATELYVFRATILVTGKHAADVKFAVILDASGTGGVITWGLSSVSPKITTGATAVAVTLVDDTASVVVLQGTIKMHSDVNANVVVQFAQNVSDASNTVVGPGSILEVLQVSDTGS